MALIKSKNNLGIEIDRETDGQWIVEIPQMPGVMAYGETKKEAIRKLYAVALRTLADIVEQGKNPQRESL